MRSKQNSPAAVLLLLVVALGVGWFMFVRPMGARASSARAEAAAAEASLALLQTGATTTVAAELGDTTDALAVAVPDLPGLANLLRDLDAIALSTGVHPATLADSPLTANPAGGGTIALSLTTTGSPEAVDAYVAQLVAMPRLLVIDTLVVTESLDGTGTLGAQLQLNGRLFTTAAPVTASTAPPATPAP